MIFYKTLYKYLFKLHLKSLLQVTLGIIVIFTISSTIDTINKSRTSIIPLSYLLKLIFSKVPYLVQEASTLIVLVSSIIFFDKLSKNRELIALKNAGLSLWQILLPSITLSISFGLIIILLLNPIVTILLSANERLEAKYIKKQHSIAMFSSNGLIIKEEDKNYNKIILAKNLTLKKLTLNNLTILLVTKENNFYQRIDAESGVLADEQLTLRKVKIYDNHLQETYQEEYTIPTSLSINHIVETLAIPETISLWEFSKVITKLKALGLITTHHQNYYSKLLLKPFFMIVMVFLAACFININPRNNKNFIRFVQACIVGFVLQFSTELLTAVLTSFNIPPLFSHFAPMLLVLLSSIFLILTHQEKL